MPGAARTHCSSAYTLDANWIVKTVKQRNNCSKQTQEQSTKRPHIHQSGDVEMLSHLLVTHLLIVIFWWQRLPLLYFAGINLVISCMLTRDSDCWTVAQLCSDGVRSCVIMAQQRLMAWLPSRMTARSRSWPWVTPPQRRARRSLSWAALSHRVNRICASPCSRKVRSVFKKGSDAASEVAQPWVHIYTHGILVHCRGVLVGGWNTLNHARTCNCK